MKTTLITLLIGGLSLLSTGLPSFTTSATAGTWTPSGPPGVGGFAHVASSADGKKLIAATDTAHYLSKDSGQTWTLGTAFGDPDSGVFFSYSGVASSADGTKLMIIGTGLFADSLSAGHIFASTDSGATWSFELVLGDESFFTACAVSADGSRRVASGGGPSALDGSISLGIWTSVDGGPWLYQPGSPLVDFVTVSADGTKLAGVVFESFDTIVWTSKDSGHTWTKRNTRQLPSFAGVRDFTGLAGSSDGQVLLVLGRGVASRHALSAVSMDAGKTWKAGLASGSGGILDACAVSADGTRMVIAGFISSPAGRAAAGVWESLDAGATWNLQPGSPTEIGALATSANGRRLLGADGDKLFVYDANPPLTLTCPPDVTVECGRGITPDKTGGSATAAGGCAGVRVSYTDRMANGPRPVVKLVTRTWKAIEGCGHTTTCQQKITIVDTKGPAIHRLVAMPATVTPANGKFVTVALDAVVEDSCSTPSQVAQNSTVSVKVTDPAGSDGKSYFVIKSLKEVQVRAKKGVSYAITLNVADAFGNKSSKTVTVTVP